MSRSMYPAGTRQGELRTVRDLLNSQALYDLFGSRAARYREQFLKIAEHEGILDSDLGDRDVHRKLSGSKAPAWNWLGFFFTAFWGAYWRLAYSWYVVGLVILVSYWFYYAEDLQTLIIGLVVIHSVFGMFGNTLLFKKVVKRAYLGELDRCTPSLPLAFMPLLIYTASWAALMMTLALELLPRM